MEHEDLRSHGRQQNKKCDSWWRLCWRLHRVTSQKEICARDQPIAKEAKTTRPLLTLPKTCSK
jgi:hypothetical protein